MRIREYGTLKMKPSGAGGVHPYHELLYIAAGEAALEWMDRSYKLAAPCLALIPADTPHWVTPRTPELAGWYLEVDLQTDAFLEYDIVLNWNQRQTRDDSRHWPRTLSVGIDAVSSVVEAYESGDLRAAAAHRLLELDIRRLLLLVQQIVSGGAGAPAPGDEPTLASDSKLYAALRHMERSYANPIAIEELAALCHLTPSYVIRLFKRTFGATPIQYLQELRLKAAISYLDTTDMPIQEIASATGFANLHYFSRLFKQKLGLSPSAWRKRQREPQPGSPPES